MKRAVAEFEGGIVFCEVCPGDVLRGHCPACGKETGPRLISDHVVGGPKELPTYLTRGPVEIWRPWVIALELMGSLDVIEGGTRAYSLREKREAHRIAQERGIKEGQREMLDSLIDGLLAGHNKGLVAGQKHVMEEAKRSMKKP